jgi:hypothetical protein
MPPDENGTKLIATCFKKFPFEMFGLLAENFGPMFILLKA